MTRSGSWIKQTGNGHSSLDSCDYKSLRFIALSVDGMCVCVTRSHELNERCGSSVGDDPGLSSRPDEQSILMETCSSIYYKERECVYDRERENAREQSRAGKRESVCETTEGLLPFNTPTQTCYPKVSYLSSVPVFLLSICSGADTG